MKKIFMIVSLIFLVVIIAACALLPQPDKFKLDNKASAPIEGFILSDFDLVTVTYDNEIIMSNGAVCSIKRPFSTTSGTELTVTLRNGDGLKFYFRTDRRKYKEEPGIVFEWTNQGSKIYENDKLISDIDSVKAIQNFPTKLVFLQEGGYYELLSDCDTIYRGSTKLPSSEYLIIESLNSDTKISGIANNHLYGFGRETILELDPDGNRRIEEKVIINR